MTKSQIFFMILIGILTQASASFGYSRPDDCQYQITHRANLQFSMQYQADRAECWHSIHPMDGYEDMVYRSYLVSSDGMFFVFNSYGHGPDAKTTGARTYYFFPREIYTYGVTLADSQVSVKINSKLTFEFESKNLYPLNKANIIFKNYASVNPKNAGGVEVLRYNGVYLDTGFMMGKTANSVPTLKSMFKNQFGQKCSIVNQTIFDYKNGDAILKSDSVLHRIVLEQCPSFKWVD